MELYTLVHEGEKVTDDSAKAKILSDYYMSSLTQEPEIIGSLPEVVDAKPQNILEDITIIQDTLRKKVDQTQSQQSEQPRLDKWQCIAKLPKFLPFLALLFNNK